MCCVCVFYVTCVSMLVYDTINRCKLFVVCVCVDVHVECGVYVFVCVFVCKKGTSYSSLLILVIDESLRESIRTRRVAISAET